ANRRQGMQIGDEVERLLVVLKCNVLADRAEVIPPVKTTGGLKAGENAHGKEFREIGIQEDRRSEDRDGLMSCSLTPIPQVLSTYLQRADDVLNSLTSLFGQSPVELIDER